MPFFSTDDGRALRPLTLLALLVTLIAACDEDPLDPDPDPDPVPVPLAIVTAASVDTAGPIYRTLHVTLDTASAIQVFYTPTAGGQVLRMTSAVSDSTHAVLLPRLRAETEYSYAVRSYRIRSLATDTVSDSIFRGTFTTDPLPPEIAAFNYSVSGTSTFPLLMVPFRSTTLGWAGQVAIDTDGEIVWYFESVGGTLVAHDMPGSHDMVFIENGFPSDGGRNGVVRVNPEREVVNLLERGSGAFGQIHHDLTALDDARVLFLAYDTMTVRDTVVTGEAIWEWNTVTGSVVKRWSSWDFIDWDTERNPSAAPSAWLHANSISIGPRGNIVVSFRSLSQIISIAPNFQSLEYRIGGPGSTHALSEADRFIGQHSAWELPNGNVLMFDNQGGGASADSAHARALELTLGADSAYMAWQYDPDPRRIAPLRGGVYRLANGNTVTIFSSMPFGVHETTPAGEVVWSMTGDQTFTNTFRVTPWPSIAGEVEVDAMP